MIELIGWLGALMFSICAVPQVYLCYKEKHADGVSALFLILWGGGELLSLVYGVVKDVPLPIVVNYVFNLLCICVIIYYRFKYRRNQ